jgi:hypothetical protein
MPLELQVAGAHVVLFGLNITKVLYLTHDDVAYGDDAKVSLMIATNAIDLPPRVATIVRQLAEQPYPRSVLRRIQNGPRLLSPGLRPGRPLAPEPV